MDMQLLSQSSLLIKLNGKFNCPSVTFLNEMIEPYRGDGYYVRVILCVSTQRLNENEDGLVRKWGTMVDGRTKNR